GIGVVETLVLFHVGTTASNTVVFVAILLGVLVQGRSLARGSRAGDDSVSDPVARLPLSARLQQVAFARHLDRYGWAALVRIPLLGHLSTPEDAYYVGLAVLALCVLALTALRRTGPGRALLAVRDNEGTAASHGLPPLAVKVVALLMSGFLAGLGGAVWGM